MFITKSLVYALCLVTPVALATQVAQEARTAQSHSALITLLSALAAGFAFAVPVLGLLLAFRRDYWQAMGERAKQHEDNVNKLDTLIADVREIRTEIYGRGGLRAEVDYTSEVRHELNSTLSSMILCMLSLSHVVGQLARAQGLEWDAQEVEDSLRESLQQLRTPRRRRGDG